MANTDREQTPSALCIALFASILFPNPLNERWMPATGTAFASKSSSRMNYLVLRQRLGESL
jgi:hypothetical protein